jgi:hypothetical protein
MQELREIVRITEQFRTAEAAGKLLRLPLVMAGLSHPPGSAGDLRDGNQ